MTDTNQKLREAFETYITDGGKWPNAILKAPGGQYLLLRTSVAWQDWKACAEALALPTAEQVDDIDVAESFTSVTKTAAPVGEREAFEQWLGITPCGAAHDFGWAAWQARAALSAGDAVDAQRMPQPHAVITGKLGTLCSFNSSELRKGDPIYTAAQIDAAMRKGQL